VLLVQELAANHDSARAREEHAGPSTTPPSSGRRHLLHLAPYSPESRDLNDPVADTPTRTRASQQGTYQYIDRVKVWKAGASSRKDLR
jgi:hypothetical protein